jgi:hypothetical protein
MMHETEKAEFGDQYEEPRILQNRVASIVPHSLGNPYSILCTNTCQLIA